MNGTPTLGMQLSNMEEFDHDADEEPERPACPTCGREMRLTVVGGHYECPNLSCMNSLEWYDWDGETLTLVPTAF